MAVVHEPFGALRRQGGIDHIMQRPARRVAHRASRRCSLPGTCTSRWAPEAAAACPGEWPLLRSPAEVRRRRGLSPRTRRPHRPARSGLPGRVLPALICPAGSCPDSSGRASSCRGSACSPGPAEVSNPRNGDPRTPCPPRGTPHNQGGEHNEAADKPGRCGGRTRVARLVPVPGLTGPGVLTLHCAPFTAFPCRVASIRGSGAGKQSQSKRSARKTRHASNKQQAKQSTHQASTRQTGSLYSSARPAMKPAGHPGSQATTAPAATAPAATAPDAIPIRRSQLRRSPRQTPCPAGR